MWLDVKVKPRWPPGLSPLDHAFWDGSVLADCNGIRSSPILFAYPFSEPVSIQYIFILCNPPRTLNLFSCYECVVLYL